MATQFEGPLSRALTAAAVDVKWSKDAWARTEVRFNDFDLLVLKNLVLAAKNEVDKESGFAVMGDYLYQAVRPSLNTDKMKLLESVDSRASTPSIGGSVKQTKNRKGGRKGGGGNKAKKGPSRADQIKMQNSLGTLMSKVEGAMNAFYESRNNIPRSTLLSENLVELRGIGLLCCAWFLLTRRKSWDIYKTVQTFSIIVSLERFIKLTKDLKGRSHLDILKDEVVSATLVADLQEKLKQLKDKFQFSGEKLYLSAPQLLIFSSYDFVLPVSTIKPYPHQSQVCKILEDNLENGCYIMYRAITNAGKTTTIVMLAALVQRIRSLRPEGDPLTKLQIIFCCNINPVKDSAGQWLFNSSNVDSISSLPFAIAFDRPSGELVIRNSFMTGEDRREKDRLVIVCSPSIAQRIMMRDRNDGIQYILFHDEPTVGAEDENSPQLIRNVDLMMRPAKWTIMSSATLPSEAELDPFIKRFKKKYPSAHVENVSSAKINIGCDTYSHSGESYLPHLGSESKDGLTKCLANIKDNMFLSRSYTPLSVSELCNYAQERVVPRIPKIDDHFSNIENLSADAVRLFGLKILTEVSSTDDSTTKAICSEPIKGMGRSVDFKQLGTTGAHKFSQMSLIACRDPLSFALDTFADLIEDINKKKVFTIEKLVGQYWKHQEQWSNEIEKIEKRMKKPASSKGRNSVGEEKQKVSYKHQLAVMKANKPVFSFPLHFQINTRLHAMKYSPSCRVSVERRPITNFSFLTDPNKNLNVMEDVLLLLCCGVGIYAPEDSRVSNSDYLEEVIKLAKRGSLAFLVADHNIAYGVNFPFTRTIVCDDFTSSHSMNTVFQLMSRAGRVGQSWFAESFVPDEVVRKLRDYAHHNSSPDGQVEITNMRTVARNIALREREMQMRLARAGVAGLRNMVGAVP